MLKTTLIRLLLISSLGVCLLTFLATRASAQIKYTISGKLTGGAGKTLYFSPDNYIANTDKLKADSIVIAADDSFKLAGKIKYPGLYSIFLPGQKAFFAFYLDGVPVSITGK